MTYTLKFSSPNAIAGVVVHMDDHRKLTLVRRARRRAAEFGGPVHVAGHRWSRSLFGMTGDQRMYAWPDGTLTFCDDDIGMDHAYELGHEFWSETLHMCVGRLVWSPWDEQYCVVRMDGEHVGEVDPQGPSFPGFLDADTYNGCVKELFHEYGMGVDGQSRVYTF